MNAGALIKKRRLELNLTVQDVAELVGVARSTVWRIEKGAMDPSEGMLLRFEIALQFTREAEK
jgi:transcriptional regulator with XRE-family HTH domain